MPVNGLNVQKVFTFQDDPALYPKYVNVREAALVFAKVLLENVPDCADQQAAIRKVREAVMTANAGIALGGLI